MTRIVTCVLLIIVISKHGAKEMGNVKMAGPGFVNDVTRGGSRISSWGGALKKLRRAEGGAKIIWRQEMVNKAFISPKFMQNTNK
jgi:hypothetical protein